MNLHQINPLMLSFVIKTEPCMNVVEIACVNAFLQVIKDETRRGQKKVWYS